MIVRPRCAQSLSARKTRLTVEHLESRRCPSVAYLSPTPPPVLDSTAQLDVSDPSRDVQSATDTPPVQTQPGLDIQVVDAVFQVDDQSGVGESTVQPDDVGGLTCCDPEEGGGEEGGGEEQGGGEEGGGEQGGGDEGGGEQGGGEEGGGEDPITPDPPCVGFSVSESVERKITISGQVGGELAAGATVNISGIVSATVAADENGCFSVTLEASSLGDISVTAVDSLGQSSQSASATFSSATPSISGGCSVDDNGFYTFSVGVTDEWISGTTVVLDGIPDNPSFTVGVGPDGTYSFALAISSGASGTVTATVIDTWGLSASCSFDLPDSPI